MSKIELKGALVVLAALAACKSPSAPAPAAPAVQPVVIGETFRLDSRILGEQRVINVYLPPGYAEGDATYPVLYMPDGGVKEDFPHISGHVDVSTKNAIIRPVLVVGIENTERRRDLVSATTVEEEKQMAPKAGGSDKFRAFLRDELKPEIARRYRVTAESAIIGESAAGNFVIETLLVEPALFDAYIAVDPSVWWNRQATARLAEERFAAWTAPPRQLFIATADTAEMVEGTAMINAAFEASKPAGLTYRYLPMPEEHHGSIFPFAALRGIRWVFAAPPAAPAP